MSNILYMKKIILFFLAFSAGLAGMAQAAGYNYPDAFYFVNEISVRGQPERPFHLEIRVRGNPADSFSRLRIYTVQVRKGKEDIIGKTMQYALRDTGSWNTYRVDGITDKAAASIYFYVAVNGNGKYLFDNLQYSIADVSGTMAEKELANQSFEDKKILNGYYSSARPSGWLQLQASPLAAEGKQSLEVTVSGQKPASIRSTARR